MGSNNVTSRFILRFERKSTIAVAVETNLPADSRHLSRQLIRGDSVDGSSRIYSYRSFRSRFNSWSLGVNLRSGADLLSKQDLGQPCFKG